MIMPKIQISSRGFLKEHPEMTAEIEQKVRLGYGLPTGEEEAQAAAAEG